jgi:xylulokinase
MMASYILAHDLGTSGNKATLFSLDGEVDAGVLYEYPVYYPGPGFVEQKPEDFWRAVCVSTKQLLEQTKVSPSDVAAVSFSGQMMGCLLVDGQGDALRNIIIWADTRASEQEAAMVKALDTDYVYKTTGHRISASYSAAKLLWVRDHEHEIFKRAGKMIHAKDYIILRLTGNIVSDYSDASGTNLFDLKKKEWDKSILSALGIPLSMLPEVLPSTAKAGTVSARAAGETGLLEGTPVITGGGDGSCACVGAGVVSEGNTYNVLGSSSWISLASREPVYDPEMRTFTWVHLDPKLYTPCGTMQAAAYSYNWYKNTLCGGEIAEAENRRINPYKLIDEGAAASPAGSGGLLYLPYLLGERSPRWNHSARGAFVGLSVTTGKGDVSRSVLEGVGFNLKVILDIVEKGAPGGNIDEMIVIGGGAKGKAWLRILSDIWQKRLVVPKYTEEATSLGAAVCGGVGIGAFRDFSVIRRFNPLLDTIEPNPALGPRYNDLYSLFNQAYEALTGIYGDLAEFNRKWPSPVKK